MNPSQSPRLQLILNCLDLLKVKSVEQVLEDLKHDSFFNEYVQFVEQHLNADSFASEELLERAFIQQMGRALVKLVTDPVVGFH